MGSEMCIRDRRLNGQYNSSGNLKSADMRYTKELDDFSLDFNLGGSSDRSYFGGVTMRTAFQPDPEGVYHQVNAQKGGQASLGLRAYIDVNGDGVFGEADKALENIEFRSNRGPVDGKTDENGRLFVSGLSESSTRFSVKDGTLPSIYLRPINEYVEVFARRGASTTLDMRFEQLGEVDGFIYAAGQVDERGEPKPLRGLDVRLVSEQTGEEVEVTRSEYDGYYVFSALSLGAYRVEVLPIWTQVQADMPAQMVVLSADKPIVMDVNLDVEMGEPVVLEDGDVVEIEPAAGDVGAGFDYYIQAGSFGARGNAEREAVRLDGALPDIDVMVREAVVNGRVYYRVVGGVGEKGAARAVCKRLVVDCRVVQGVDL